MPHTIHLPVRWGILGAGHIAHKFAGDLLMSPDCRLTAVASRSKENADQFATQFDIPRRHGNYQGLADDPEVDVVEHAARSEPVADPTALEDDFPVHQLAAPADQGQSRRCSRRRAASMPKPNPASTAR